MTFERDPNHLNYLIGFVRVECAGGVVKNIVCDYKHDAASLAIYTMSELFSLKFEKILLSVY